MKRAFFNFIRIFNKNRAFTLVELILVIAVLAVLAALLLPLISGYLNQSSDAACASNRGTARLEVSAALASFYSGQSDASDEAEAIKICMEQQMRASASGSGYAGICPTDGVYTVSIGRDGSVLIFCSTHGGDEADAEANLSTATTQQGLLALKGMIGAVKQDYFTANNLGNEAKIESTDATEYTQTVNAMLRQLGYDPEQSYWRMTKKADGIHVYWAEDISALSAGSKVDVFRATENGPTIYKGTGTVAQRTVNGKTYNYFTTIGGFKNTGERLN